MGATAYGTYLSRMMDSVAVPDGRSSIMLFIHGGLVDQGQALARAMVALEDIEQFNARDARPGTYRTYPIWFNWESGMFQVVGERLFQRHGDGAGSAALSLVSLAPRFVLGLGRALLQAPRTTLDQAGNWTRRAFNGDDYRESGLGGVSGSPDCEHRLHGRRRFHQGDGARGRATAPA